MNNFKFGTIVSGDYFTDRKNELATIKCRLDSENHLILISPRRFGKSSLVRKCLTELQRPYVWLDLQYVLSVSDFATQLLKATLSQYPYEKIKYEIRHFRIIPTLSINPNINEWQVSFQPSADTTVLLEDVMQLLEKLSKQDERLIVVLDEFQEIKQISKYFDKQLRAIMQHQVGINYIFMGSQEGMMREIFEQKKSPFYHFGQLRRLDKISYEDFYDFLYERLPNVENKDTLAKEILSFTSCHPYYTQQLAAQVWELISYKHVHENVVAQAVQTISEVHDLDYERLWNSLNRTDRSILLQLARSENPLQNRILATSTTFSALTRLQKSGFVIRTTEYELEDPFFCYWLKRQ